MDTPRSPSPASRADNISSVGTGAIQFVLSLLAIAGAATLVLSALGLLTAEPALAILAVISILTAGFAVLWIRASEQARTVGTHRDLRDRPAVSWTSLVEAIPDPAMVLDASSTILHHNPAAEALFGKPVASLPLEHVSRDPELIMAVESGLETGRTRTVRIVPNSSGKRHLMAVVAPLGARESGGANAVLITIRDLSDQHRLLEMRSDFIANASHELRTPLASVRGFIETLQGPARNDEVARMRFLGIMASQAERMTRLIDDLLLLSRVEEKAYLVPTGTVEINELVAHVVQTLGPLAEEKEYTVTVTPAVRHASVKGDPDELFQVFQNLIENAVKYGSVGGSVSVDCRLVQPTPASSERIVVTIADDGPGIASEHVPRLTERFYRVNADQSRTVGGTGLGLAIVKHVLNRHQGELSVESQLGVGSSFRVTLPVHKTK